MGKQIVSYSQFWRPVRICMMAALALLTIYPHAYAKDKAFYVPLNRSELIVTSSDMGEVIITDPDVADVYVHGKNKISVIGRTIGTTTLRVFSPSNRLLRSMDVVVTYDLPAIRKAMREFLPGEQIGVELVNTRIALTGEISSTQAANTAIEIAEQFVQGKLEDNELTSREVVSADDVSRRSPILNFLKIAAGQQVMLRIRIGEISRSAVRNLGVSLQAVRNGSLGFRIGTGGVANQVGSVLANIPAAQDAFSQIEFGKTISNGSFGLALDALEQDGLLKTLAEPNLVALSGESAEFLAGGEFPIPVPQGNQTTTIEFRQFGVALKFTPFVLSENRIRVQVNPEVSSLSNNGAIRTDDGLSIPSIVTRRASTTVELAPGESFMIAGLLQDDITSQINQFPGASDIPIFGALLRSTSFQRSETEVVFVVTPYLVDPIKSSDVKLPTDNFRPASTMEAMFYGALGKVFGTKSVSPSAEGPIGFITD
jgi:pilus assembly protein CpaC